MKRGKFQALGRVRQDGPGAFFRARASFPFFPIFPVILEGKEKRAGQGGGRDEGKQVHRRGSRAGARLDLERFVADQDGGKAGLSEVDRLPLVEHANAGQRGRCRKAHGGTAWHGREVRQDR